MILRCRLCHAPIASCTPADLSLPLTGAMFAPLEPGFPPPFAADVPWERLRCPVCRHHPQGYDPADRNRLETDEGMVELTTATRRPAAGRQVKREQ